jgi:nucleotide-binding universal stress UspA family protein
MDLVVMGSVGRTGVSKFLLGSVTDKVVRNSKVPAMVVY